MIFNRPPPSPLIFWFLYGFESDLLEGYNAEFLQKDLKFCREKRLCLEWVMDLRRMLSISLILIFTGVDADFLFRDELDYL